MSGTHRAWNLSYQTKGRRRYGNGAHTLDPSVIRVRHSGETAIAVREAATRSRHEGFILLYGSTVILTEVHTYKINFVYLTKYLSNSPRLYLYFQIKIFLDRLFMYINRLI